MQIHSKKYRKIFGGLFLSVYLTFIIVGTLHYHPYDLVKKSEYTDKTTSNRTTDLSSDFFSICSLHQFSQTIDNDSYSSSNIVLALTKIETSLYLKEISNVNATSSSILPSRAPPLFS